MSDLTNLDAVEQRDLRRAFGRFPSGVTALAGVVKESPVGMAVSSFTNVSLDPPLVSVCIQKASATWPALRRGAHLGVSVLSESHEALCRQLAAKDEDRFAGVDYDVADSGAIFIKESPLWLDCKIWEEIEAGDHWVVILEIVALSSSEDVTPIVFHDSRFRRLSTELAIA